MIGKFEQHLGGGISCDAEVTIEFHVIGSIGPE
jgi:hypothetical protein